MSDNTQKSGSSESILMAQAKLSEELISKEMSVSHHIPGGEHKGGKREKEIGGRDGPDPTRFGDWEKNGRCIDF